MNKKTDILDAWITIEQLSEGSIKKNDQQLRPFDQRMDNEFEGQFIEFITIQKKKTNAKKDVGLVFYFDIFNFQEIINILRKKYKILATEEETNSSEKFTFALYFDEELNFISEKLFFTISGYIRYKNELPKDFFKAEESLRDDLTKQFEDKEFNTVMIDLLKQYNVSLDNCRYGFIKDLENTDVNLHSFFIDDLQKAKKINTGNMERYLTEYSENRQNLDSKSDSQNFNPLLFQEILQPKYYPLGRFPTNPDYSLSFMQEVTVNLALNEKNTIRSVNGPPGTGKTTLLKDIFAELVVQQAADICNLSDKKIKGSLVYWEKAKLGILPFQIAEKNSIVASSNNGAVQNIVNELPQIEAIPEEFREKILEADYFKTIANLEQEPNKKNNTELQDDVNWGTFSLEGGAKANITKLLSKITSIENYLKKEYQSDASVYQEFSKLYNEVFNERNNVQKYYEQMKHAQELKIKYKQESKSYSNEKNQNQNRLNKFIQQSKLQSDSINEEQQKWETILDEVQLEINNLSQESNQLQRNYEVIKSQQPSFFGLKKLFHSAKVSEYFERLNEANEKLNENEKEKRSLSSTKIKAKLELKKAWKDSEQLKKQVKQETAKFNHWSNTQEQNLNELVHKINSIMEQKGQSKIEELDFSKSYEDLQKSNPWFTKKYRIKQSELFILSLKVRKQFLYENSKHLATAKNIWKRQPEYSSKQNGEKLLIESWHWINFVIPIISTTFASFGRMFQHIPENTIGNLFIDEAGQALPQASIGAIFRSKKIMVVGDPSQIKPVLTLDSNVLNLLGQNYQVNEKFVSTEASTQTLVDATSQYGFQKNEDEWIGIPLWVHRRSNYPMFTISNELSYGGLMVQGKPADSAQGQSEWFDISGKANDKFVTEQANFLKAKIMERLEENPDLAGEIYVISPFKHVAYKLATALDSIGFTKREGRKVVNVGTVHTFQGKEAKIVYFVLGADKSSQGAASWAVSDSNMMNVAATRAKEEFYIIGDKTLYASLGSEVANQTISIIEDYNRKTR
ncbi:AAA domain-containing protein [Carnobacterium divergens]|uniref:AAA domain-containing protein n=1 Tax=Carnobacterium divergens TaxID=2748 RepID=UPI00128B5326|nr:AAA domain-containing protein [Carnobacterium divergens]MPQ23312.1 replication ATP-dependent helicase [Carnobacterium divergens]